MTVVITSTHIKDSRDFHQNEVRTVVSVTSNNVRSTLKLNQKLNHAHWASADYQVRICVIIDRRRSALV